MPGVVCTNLNVTPGQKITVKGDIPSGCKSFAVNLGKDDNNLLLHLNARFDIHGDIRTIVCNSKNQGQWGKELRETNFPFQEGGPTELSFIHDKKEVTITLPGNHQFKFPNETGLETITFICTDGELKFKSVSLG
ncbi:PREDICTED: galectin-1 [Thamnophis sirtalis]|uniref:Galectin n=1 Tax=Thamnophis sirtalis TaxID=35019 RepID=A0A6I9XTD3_9SAUR|nr:PREDICTED: galectin-1 [Thamnophis sirtalis]